MPTMLPFELMLMWIATAAADTIPVTKIAVLAPRDTGNPDSDTVGYEGILTEGTITLYVPKTCPPGFTWYASGEATKYGGCCFGTACSRVATACSDGYKIYSGISLWASSSLCRNSCYQDIVLQSLGDTASPTLQYVCGESLTGATLYRTWPGGITASLTIDNTEESARAASSTAAPSSITTPSMPSVASASTSSMPSTTSFVTGTASAPAAFTPITKSSLAGPVAGGVAGGCGLLAIIAIVAVWCIMRRRASRDVKESYSAPYSRHRNPKSPSKKIKHDKAIGLSRLG